MNEAKCTQNAAPVLFNPYKVESWFMVNAQDLSIFGCFNRVRLLKVSKVLPRCRAVFPLAAKLPTNGGVLQVSLSISADIFWSDSLMAVGRR